MGRVMLLRCEKEKTWIDDPHDDVTYWIGRMNCEAFKIRGRKSCCCTTIYHRSTEGYQ